MTIAALIIGVIVGCIFIYLVLKPKLNKVEILNEDIIKQNKDIIRQNEQAKNENISLQIEKQSLIDSINESQIQLKNTQLNIEELKQKSAEAAQAIYESNLQVAMEHLSAQTEKIGKKYQDYEEQCKEHYTSLLEEQCQRYNEEIQMKTAEANAIREQLKTLQSNLLAVIEANKKIQAEVDQLNFYRLQLTDDDLNEVGQLKDVSKHLRNSEPLNKIIWKTYYEKPYTDLTSRLSLDKNLIGIYKITNINSKLCYIGQSVNIKERFREHIKCGLGIGTLNNKLYSAMKREGVENFIFEIIETCDRAQLNDKEKYWIAFYHSDIDGYNMTKGNTTK